MLARPGGQPLGRFLGELCGAEAVLLFSCSLVLATLLASIERAFGGLDRVAVWHRRAAVPGVLLLIPHVALVSSAPDRYATSLGHALGDIRCSVSSCSRCGRLHRVSARPGGLGLCDGWRARATSDG